MKIELSAKEIAILCSGMDALVVQLQALPILKGVEPTNEIKDSCKRIIDKLIKSCNPHVQDKIKTINNLLDNELEILS